MKYGFAARNAVSNGHNPMSLADIAKPIRSKVAACEEFQETWKQDHEQALLVFNLEDLLHDVVECYDDLQRFDQAFLKQISSDAHSYDEELDNLIIELCGRIHHLAEAIDIELLAPFEEEYGELDNSYLFRNRLGRAQESAKFGYRKDAHERSEQLADQIWDALNPSGS